LWICESAGQAEKRVRRVKALLEGDAVKKDWCSSPKDGYGPFRVTDADKWTSTQVYVDRPLQSVDPTLEAVGSGGAITGGHFDLIICDDLEDDKTTYSQTLRDKTRQWFRATIGPMLVKGGLQLVIGTRKHNDDLYGHLLDDPTYRVIADKAILQWPEKYTFKTEKDDMGREVLSGVSVEGPSEVLWEAERPIEYLLRERRSIGGRLFGREFQNEVLDDDTAAFRWSWLEDACFRGRDMRLYELPNVDGLDVVQGYDLALVTSAKHAESRDTDYTVGITWARDNKGNRYLLGLHKRRGMTSAQLQNFVKGEYAKLAQLGAPPRVVAVEKNSFGELHFLGLQRDTDLPLKPHLTTGKNKADPWEGVPSLGTLFENGKVVLPTGDERSRALMRELCMELWGLGREKHDDMVMALWIAETVLRKNAFVHQVSFGDDINYQAEADERMAGVEILDDFDGGSLNKFEGSNAWKGLLPVEDM